MLDTEAIQTIAVFTLESWIRDNVENGDEVVDDLSEIISNNDISFGCNAGTLIKHADMRMFVSDALDHVFPGLENENKREQILADLEVELPKGEWFWSLEC